MLHYVLLIIGCLISACGLNLFLVQHQLLSGGVGGLALIAYYLFSLPVGMLILVMNLPLLYAAYRFLGKRYLIGSIFGTVLYALLVDATQFLNAYYIIDDTMLAAIYGGVICGLGFGIVFRAGYNTGGFDIISAIVKQYYGINIGTFNFLVNSIIVLLSALLFGLKPAMFTLISMFITAQLTNRVVSGFNHKKTVMIVSDSVREIADEIIEELGRGVTFLHGEGAFTRQPRRVIFVVVNLTQIARIKMLTAKVDPYAFMIVQDASEVMGRGFTLPKSSHPVERRAKEED
ncbi:MAG: YitT family protein [Selenomonadales bacterium]|nr:YitT family protein [Selenomonadales bacterium]